MEIAFQIIAGWYIIDLITGLYHYILDNTSKTHWLLGNQARDFADHHENPKSMEAFGFVERNKIPFLSSLLALVFACFGLPWFWITIFIGGAISQQAHHWSHSPCPYFVRKLQIIGILISPEKHQRHHSNFNRCFGILNGWSHGFLDFILGGK